MNPHLLALAIADAPRPTASALPVLPAPTGALSDILFPDLDLTEYDPPKLNRAQLRAARRSKA